MEKECVLNELSLSGQYESLDDFVATGAKDLVSVLDELHKFGIQVLYKKSDIYEAEVSSGLKFMSVLFHKENRINDELKRLKSKLAHLQGEPFWDLDMHQDLSSTYVMIDTEGNVVKDVSNTGIAEAYARRVYLISFTPSDYNISPILVKKENEIEIGVENYWHSGQFMERLFSAGLITPEDYFKLKFTTKFDFTHIRKSSGFNLININNIGLFNSAFKKFEGLPWCNIPMDDGLDYKEFTKNRYTKDFFSSEEWSMKIMKFRVYDEIRCFGYVKSGKFHVLRIDLDHKLSDLG